MRYTIIVFSFLLFPLGSIAQELDYIVHASYGKPILKEKLVSAKKISDLKSDYPSSWISDSDYVSTEIIAIREGVERRAAGENINLNTVQQKILQSADIGTSINVEVKYNSKNSITGETNEHTMNFTITHIPKIEAAYSDGDEKLKLYLKENAIDKINQTSFNKFEFSALKFYINKDGRPINARLVKSSGDDTVDQILINAIENMPKWKPAEDEDGNKVVQEFEFNVGLMIGC